MCSYTFLKGIKNRIDFIPHPSFTVCNRKSKPRYLTIYTRIMCTNRKSILIVRSIYISAIFIYTNKRIVAIKIGMIIGNKINNHG